MATPFMIGVAIGLALVCLLLLLALLVPADKAPGGW